MRKKRNGYWVSLLVGLLILSFGAAPAALGQGVTIESKSVAPGAQGFTVSVDLTDHPNVRGGDLRFVYPTDAMTFVTGEVLAGGSWLVSQVKEDTAGEVTVLLAGMPGQVAAAASTTLAELSFNMSDTVDLDSYTISYGEASALAADDNSAIAVTATDGIISIAKEPTVDVTIAPADGSWGTTNPAPGKNTHEAGQSPTYTVTPVAGYRVSSFAITGSDDYTTATLEADNTYTFSPALDTGDILAMAVEFELIPTWTITASAGDNGSISSEGPTTYEEGTDVAYTITPAEHYTLDTIEVLGDDDPITTIDGADFTYSYGVLAGSGESTISVTFKLKNYTITATADGNGAITPEGEGDYAALSTPSFTLTPDTENNFVIDTCTVDGVDVTELLVASEENPKVMTYTFAELTAPATIDVAYKLGVFTLTVKAVTDGGTIKPKGDVVVIAEDKQEFTVTSEQGDDEWWVLDRIKVMWADGEVEKYYAEDLDDDGNFKTAKVLQDATVKVYFKQVHFVFATTDALGPEGIDIAAVGAITPADSVTVDNGATQNFTATLNAGYEDWVVDLIVDDVAIGAASYDFLGEGAVNHTVIAQFEHPNVQKVLNSGDANMDFDIDFDELVFVIALYNGKGHYCPAGATGYGLSFMAGESTDPNAYLCVPHGSDYDHPEGESTQNWVIEFSELLRAIQLYNAGAYCNAEGTEDGFAPGICE
ncbi:cohesin domain-containing protein [Desulfococcaceae bacterium HSG8]|nr:cohesin domain-containing protein [Desulfococcaceae bacterium HSG8]